MNLRLKNTFTEQLPGDPKLENRARNVLGSCFSYTRPEKTKDPTLIHCSETLAAELGIPKKDLFSKTFSNLVTGNHVLKGSQPFAMCYGGHQFGHWAGQLGDGRAINIAEIEHNQASWTLQLKGAGPTPYSRSADGRAVLRSSLREYLCSEAMHHLGIPTTRALSLALTGDKVLRDVLYDGNPAYEKGAIVCRVAPSFLRFGSYELFTARNDLDTLKKLVNYTLEHHFPHLGNPSKESYTAFFKEVSEKTLETILHWQRVGFVHGVMNTDNLSILGLTIDYGPYGWLEGYDPNWTPNTTDQPHKRYRYTNQPQIGLWNLIKLANALFPLIQETDAVEKILENYQVSFEQKALQMHKSKLGLYTCQKEDQKLVEDLLKTLQLAETDMTLFFRNLSNIKRDSSASDALKIIHGAFYQPEQLKEPLLQEWEAWLVLYQKRLQKEPLSDQRRKQKMDETNPKYVLRNYMAQLAIDAAEKGDYRVLNELFELLKNPYKEQPHAEKWFSKRPEWARHKVGCSVLSCSS